LAEDRVQQGYSINGFETSGSFTKELVCLFVCLFVGQSVYRRGEKYLKRSTASGKTEQKEEKILQFIMYLCKLPII